MGDRHSSGVEYLDHYLAGGVPDGTIITILTDPMTQGELLLRNLSVRQSVLYLTTVRTADAVREWLREAASPADDSPSSIGRGETGSRGDDPVDVRSVDLDDPLADLEDEIASLREPSTIIVDSMNVLEDEPKRRYLSFLNELEDRVRDDGHICYVHRLYDDSYRTSVGTDQRSNREHLLQISDSVWKISSGMVDEEVKHFLIIEKNRFGPVLADPLQVNMEGGISIDTSRSI